MHAKHHELFTQIYFIHWIHFRNLLLRLESLKKRRTLIVYRLDFNCPLWQKMTSQLVTFDRNSSVIVVENSDVLTSFSSTAPIFQNFRENSVVKYILWSSVLSIKMMKNAGYFTQLSCRMVTSSHIQITFIMGFGQKLAYARICKFLLFSSSSAILYGFCVIRRLCGADELM